MRKTLTLLSAAFVLCQTAPLDSLAMEKAGKKDSLFQRIAGSLKKDVGAPAIDEWANQVYRLSVQTDKFCSGQVSKVEEGGGFLFDAQAGIVCTSSHLVSPTAPSTIELKTFDGRLYKGADIEILAFSPIGFPGDFTFLHVAGLAQQKQMPIDPKIRPDEKSVVFHIDFLPNAYSRGASLIMKRDHISLGSVAHRHTSILLMQQGTNSEASLGGPVFDRHGVVVGMLEKNQMLPILYPYFIFDMYVRHGKRPEAFYFEGLLTPMPRTMMETYFGFSVIDILRKQPKIAEFGETVMGVSSQQFVASPFKTMDVVLEIGNLPVTQNLMHLPFLFLDKESVPCKIWRQGNILDLQIPLYKSVESTPIFLDVDGVSVLKLPPCHSRAIGFAENAAVSKTQNSLFVVSYIDDIPTPTFNDFIRVLYDIVEEKQLDHLTFRGTEVGFPSKIVHVSNDLTQWRGKTFDLVLFDEQAHGWKKMDYKDYVKSIK